MYFCVFFEFFGEVQQCVIYAFYVILFAFLAFSIKKEFVYENTSEKQSMRSACMTVDEVEAITGIDFYPALPDEVEDAVEATYDINSALAFSFYFYQEFVI